jgi:predicted acylesterase/phospholipase RssA
MDNEYLYAQSFTGTKHVITTYFLELQVSLNFITESKLISPVDKMEFLKYISRMYGRTALCLSGGASLAYYHLGVAKALFENNALPHIFTGASAGALIAALICVRTDSELKGQGKMHCCLRQVFTPDVFARLAKGGSAFELGNLMRLFKTGAMYDSSLWYEKVVALVTNGEMTFMEAFQRTGRILNITGLKVHLTRL